METISKVAKETSEIEEKQEHPLVEIVNGTILVHLREKYFNSRSEYRGAA